MKIKNSNENLYIVKSTSRRNLKISGYANVFSMVDSYGDIVEMGAFAKSLENPRFNNIKLLWQHDANRPIGVITLIREDNYGLYIEANINSKTAAGQESIELILQGAISGLSIGFNIVESYNNNDGNRIIKKADLWEVSIVTFPANKGSYISHHTEDLHSNNSNQDNQISKNIAIDNQVNLENLQENKFNDKIYDEAIFHISHLVSLIKK